MTSTSQTTATPSAHAVNGPDAPRSAGPDVPPPDLTLYGIVHRALRRGADRLATATAELVERPDPARSAALQRWYRGYLAELHSHHEIEDQILFPEVARRAPEMHDHEARVDVEHHMLVECMDQLDRELRDATGRPRDRGVLRAAAATAHDLAVLMHAHLDHEDVHIIPLIASTLTGPEFDELEEQARKHGSLSTMAFAVPFLVESAEPDEMEHLLDTAGAPLRLLLLLTRGRYARRTRAAFDDAPTALQGV